jgi:hypothetical protein
MVHSPPLDFITSPRRLITNEMDPRFVYPKSLAGRAAGEFWRRGCRGMARFIVRESLEMFCKVACGLVVWGQVIIRISS